MTKIVRKVERKEAIREITEDLMHEYRRLATYDFNAFMGREERNREHRYYFGRGATLDELVDQDRDNITKKIEDLNKRYQQLLALYSSYDEFVYLSDD